MTENTEATPEATPDQNAAPVAAAVPAVPTDPAAEVGKIVLFIDQTESFEAGHNFVPFAQFARAHGVDTISPKRGEGTDKWYGTAEELAAERAAVLAEGVGYMPFLYSVGPKFGIVPGECEVLKEIMSVNHDCVCCDMESEWNGQFSAASEFESLMRPVPGLLYVTTFGDPKTQNFPLRQIAPCVNCWVPQDYDNWLASLDAADLAEGMTIVQPALDLSGEFGPNNVVQIAAQMRARGHKALWLWCHRFAAANPELLRLVVQAFKG